MGKIFHLLDDKFSMMESQRKIHVYFLFLTRRENNFFISYLKMIVLSTFYLFFFLLEVIYTPHNWNLNIFHCNSFFIRTIAFCFILFSISKGSKTHSCEFFPSIFLMRKIFCPFMDFII
jgi:hypothetical protein